jgi:methionyl-tRNA formyltransferase
MPHNKAVVFAYHTVGVKCLQALIDHDFEIPLVISHEDSPGETIWFDSVKDLCQQHQIQCITPTDLKDPQVQKKIQEIHPDYIFSFYYRSMIPNEILQMASIAALNMHGSLLPKYRGRVPINWAVLHGETKTGATLHIMETKPDAGDIVHQKSVPILPDETAFEVFLKVADIAATTLIETIPDLLTGEFSRRPNRLQEGSYFGGRKPADGLIDWQKDAQSIYNLVRAVAPPYPGAFTVMKGKTFIVAKAMLASIPNRSFSQQLGLQVVDNRVYGFCGDERALYITELIYQDQLINPTQLQLLLLEINKD